MRRTSCRWPNPSPRDCPARDGGSGMKKQCERDHAIHPLHPRCRRQATGAAGPATRKRPQAPSLTRRAGPASGARHGSSTGSTRFRPRVQHDTDVVERHWQQHEGQGRDRRRDDLPAARPDAWQGKQEQRWLEQHQGKRGPPHGADGYEHRDPQPGIAGRDDLDAPERCHAETDHGPRPERRAVMDDDRRDHDQRDAPPEEVWQVRPGTSHASANGAYRICPCTVSYGPLTCSG